MSIKGLRIPLIILSACLAFGILLGGNLLYQEFSVRRPLLNKLQAIPGVQAVELQKEKTGNVLKVRLEESVELSETYKLIEDAIAKSGNLELELKLEDRRNKKLAELLQDNQFTIYEALANGNFSTMSQNVTQIMEITDSVEWELDIDASNIYFEMREGSNYLYEVIPRQQKSS